MEYVQIDVSWDDALLKRRGYPQGVEITTKAWNAFMRSIEAHDSGAGQGRYRVAEWYNAISMDSLFKEMPRPISGKLAYPKAPIWDYMEAFPFRHGMHACVSERFRILLEKLNVSPLEYRLEPISVTGVKGPLYLFFTPQMIPWDDLDVDYEKSVFVDKYRDIVPGVTTQYFYDNTNCRPWNVVARRSPLFKDIFQLDYCIGLFISRRLMQAFQEEKLIGIEEQGKRFRVNLSFV